MVMPAEKNPGRLVLSHGLGLLAFFVIGVVGGITYLLVTSKVFGHRPMGFGNAAALFVLPIFSLAFGILVWLPVSIVHRLKWGVMSWARAFAIACLIVFVLVMLFIGPPGFTTRGGAYMMNYFVIPMLVIGAMTHHALTRNK